MLEALANFVGKIGFGSCIGRIRSGKTQVPILPDFQFAVAEGRAVSGGKLANPTEHCFGIWNPEKGQILMQGFQINLSFNLRHLQQSFHFRGKRQLSSAVSVVEGFHPKVVTRQKQIWTARAQIANGKGEHAIEPLNAIFTFLLVKVNYDFRIGVRGKVVALALQLAAKFGEIVDFSVVGNPDGAVFVAHRHVPIRRQIKDGKAAAAKANIGAVGESSLPQTRVVGTTVRLRVRHAGERFPVPTVGESGDPTHD